MITENILIGTFVGITFTFICDTKQTLLDHYFITVTVWVKIHSK